MLAVCYPLSGSLITIALRMLHVSDTKISSGTKIAAYGNPVFSGSDMLVRLLMSAPKFCNEIIASDAIWDSFAKNDVLERV